MIRPDYLHPTKTVPVEDEGAEKSADENTNDDISYMLISFAEPRSLIGCSLPL